MFVQNFNETRQVCSGRHHDVRVFLLPLSWPMVPEEQRVHVSHPSQGLLREFHPDLDDAGRSIVTFMNSNHVKGRCFQATANLRFSITSPSHQKYQLTCSLYSTVRWTNYVD